MAAKLRIEYIVEPDAAALARRAAQHFVEMAEEAVAARGRARIAISGGSTPEGGVPACWPTRTQPWRARMPWDKLDLYWVDERCVPPDRRREQLPHDARGAAGPCAAAPEQVHRMEGELDPEVAAARYESVLRNNFRLEGAESPAL